MEESPKTLPNIFDIKQAAKRISKHSILTPLIESSLLNRIAGGRILVKAETLQKTGAFKFRGALNALSLLNPKQKEMGVLAYSSGNHAHAIACAAQLLALKAHVVIPSDAPKIKLEGASSYGAHIHQYNRAEENREKLGQMLAEEHKLTIIKPYDEPTVIAGQGTTGLEIVDQCIRLNVLPDLIVVPTGGGGLIAGVGLAISDTWPNTKIYAAEPFGWDDHRLSIESGYRKSVTDTNFYSICDALLAPIPGKITYEINKNMLEKSLVVSDKEVIRAMALAFKYLKLVIEPGGAVALAAALTNQIDIYGKTIVVVASGGNIDMDKYFHLLSKG